MMQSNDFYTHLPFMGTDDGGDPNQLGLTLQKVHLGPTPTTSWSRARAGGHNQQPDLVATRYINSMYVNIEYEL